MKMKLNLSGDGIKGFFFNNGEKLLLGITALVLLFFLYGAVTAKPLEDSKSPRAIVAKSTQKMDIIRAPGEPPPGEFLIPDIARNAKETVEPLADVRANLLVHRTPWDRPVFQELSLRTDPEYYAVEDLKAAAVVGIVPYLPPEAQPAAGAVAAAPMTARPVQPRNTGHDDDPNVYVKRPPRLGGVAQPGALGAGVAAAAAQPIVGASAYGAHALGMDPQPKCMAVITGLLPVEKQAEAYRRTFEYALPSGQVEVPVYQWFIVERTEVKDAADTNYNWQRFPDPADPQKTTFYSKALTDIARWAVGTPELADPQYPCDPQTIVIPQSSGTPLSIVTYMTWPLPPMYLKNWGAEAVHPKVPLFKPQEVAVQAPGNPAQGVNLDQAATMPNAAPIANGGAPNPALAGQRGQFANGMVADPAAPPPVPSKLFRFVDATAKAGKTYRYRIQVVLANPNYINPLNPNNTLLLRHLAKPQQLFSSNSPWSEPTHAVTMPRDYRLLAENVTGGRGAEPKAKVDILKFVRTAADPAAAAAMPGVAAAAASQVWLEVIKDADLLLGGVAYLPDVTLEKVFDPTIETERKVEKVTISTNQSMLLDVRNDDPLGATNKSKNPSEMLFIDAEGRLVSLNSAADFAVRKDYKDRTTPVQIPVDGGVVPAPGINPVPAPAVRPAPIPAVRPGGRVRGDG